MGILGRIRLSQEASLLISAVVAIVMLVWQGLEDGLSLREALMAALVFIGGGAIRTQVFSKTSVNQIRAGGRLDR